MFTGIITDMGTVRAVEKAPDGDTRFEFQTAFDTATINIGASICCSGGCMTVIETGPDWFAISASAETLSKTTMPSWKEGDRVNLERALKVGDELGGHYVSGHVDGVGRVASITPDGDSLRFVFEAPEDLKLFMAPKGSVAVDGVSLTVNAVEDRNFGINIIPHTQEETTLGRLSPGDTVNLEIDMLARYVVRLLEKE